MNLLASCKSHWKIIPLSLYSAIPTAPYRHAFSHKIKKIVLQTETSIQDVLSHEHQNTMLAADSGSLVFLSGTFLLVVPPNALHFATLKNSCCSTITNTSRNIFEIHANPITRSSQYPLHRPAAKHAWIFGKRSTKQCETPIQRTIRTRSQKSARIIVINSRKLGNSL